MTLVDSLKKFLTKLGGNPNELENNATSAEIIDAISEAYTDKEGTYTEVTPIGSEGTKIATITTNNTAHDIYAPKELPAATSEDAGMVLSVNGEGAWTKANPPTELPAVTSADEGDVLGVNSSGEWVKTTPSSGASFFDVTISYDTSGMLAKWKPNKTASEIKTAYDNGDIIRAIIDFSNYPSVSIGNRIIYLTSINTSGSSWTFDFSWLEMEGTTFDIYGFKIAGSNVVFTSEIRHQ